MKDSSERTYILGISCYYHDSSAALLRDGEIIAAAEEERFTRKKHDNTFPLQSIQYCLEQAGITIKDVKYVAFYEKPFIKFERLLHQHLATFPRSYPQFLKAMPSWLNEKLRVKRTIRKRLKYPGKILFIDHHLSHAASSFLPSPFEKAAIVTVDGVGEWTTTAYGQGKGIEVELTKEILFPHSIGLLYSTITAYLGFKVNNSEYKVMGLASYGNMERSSNDHYKKLQTIVDVRKDGSFRFDMSYFTYTHSNRMPSSKLCKLLGGRVTRPGAQVDQRMKDIAAALQLLTEDLLYNLLEAVHKKTGQKNLVLAGGVALNSVANGKILSQTGFESLWMQPNASDGGTSLGAALYVHHTLLGNKERREMKTAYLGPSYSDSHIKHYLQSNGITHERFTSEEELLKQTAKLLADNQVVGWFQLGMEWGPRALGARSILANPCNPNAQRLLNEKVKHREIFRPFAPVVPAEDANTYFTCDTPIPAPTDFMLMVYPIKEKWHKVIPSVTHVDGSGRLQTIRKEQNPLYHGLLKEFGKHTKIPILINTSFNIRGEPIVCTPHDAYRCMMGTGIDCLVIGNYLVRRNDNQKDKWDSEETAKD